MPHNQRDIAYLVKNLSESDTILKLLMNFEKVLDVAGVFAYRNWDVGELVDGPHIDRYWFKTTWMYPLKMMPDPKGGLRLIDMDCKVTFCKDTFLQPIRVFGPEDRMPDQELNKRAQVKKIPVWLVTIDMPRRHVDDSNLAVFDVSGEEIDVSDIQQQLDDTPAEMGEVKPPKVDAEDTPETFGDNDDGEMPWA